MVGMVEMAETVGTAGARKAGAREAQETIDGKAEAERRARAALQKLMARMAARREVLLGILDYCREPREVEDVDARVAQLQAHNASVYDGASLCAMLEEAGGLENVAPGGEEESPTEDENDNPTGSATSETTAGATDAAISVAEDSEPVAEVVDGVEYLSPAPRSRTLWRTTVAGAELLASYSPQADIARLLENDGAYIDIYLRVLDLCADEGGAATPELSAAVDKDPLVQSPRLFVQHFVERLEKAGAVRWDGRWRITDAGRDWLDEAAR